jgi:hypothetical protein
MRLVSYLLGLVAAALVLILVDHSPSDSANQISLLILVLAAVSLGFAAPRWAWLSALVLGGSLAAVHAIYFAMGLTLPYPMSPTGWAGPASLLILIIPAGLVAYFGAGVAVLRTRRRQTTAR